MRSQALIALLTGLSALMAARPLRAQIIGAPAYHETHDHGMPYPEAPARYASGGATCSPAPCVLQNEEISPGQANTTIISADPRKPTRLLAVAADYSCLFRFGIYASNNGGLTWSDSCVESFASPGDPTLAYGMEMAFIASAAPDHLEWDTVLESSSDNGATGYKLSRGKCYTPLADDRNDNDS